MKLSARVTECRERSALRQSFVSLVVLTAHCLLASCGQTYNATTTITPPAAIMADPGLSITGLKAFQQDVALEGSCRTGTVKLDYRAEAARLTQEAWRMYRQGTPSISEAGVQFESLNLQTHCGGSVSGNVFIYLNTTTKCTSEATLTATLSAEGTTVTESVSTQANAWEREANCEIASESLQAAVTKAINSVLAGLLNLETVSDPSVKQSQ